MDGLESVARIRQGAGDDDGHGVIQIRAAHLVVNIYLFDGADDLLERSIRCHGFQGLAGGFGFHKISFNHEGHEGTPLPALAQVQV